MIDRLTLAYDARLPPKPSGVGIYTRELLQALARIDTLRIVALAAPRQPLPPGVERLATDVAFDDHGPAEWFEHLRLPLLLRERGVDVIHGPNTIVPVGPAPYARVATVHDVAFRRFAETLTPAFRLLMRVRTRTALRVSDAVVAVSRFTADELAALYPEDAHKVVPVPSATPEETRRHRVDAARAEALLARLGLTARRYVCAIGTLEPRKNLVTLLRAFEHARLEGFKLALVGDRGWRDGPLQEALSRVPPGSVVLTGWLDGPPMRDLLARSAGLLYPSLYEGFGFPPLEALALGVPVVSADLPPIRESCEGRAILIAPRDVDGWAQVLRQLIHRKPQRCWVGRKFDDVARDMVEVYRGALARKHGVARLDERVARPESRQARTRPRIARAGLDKPTSVA